jgi:hypothetical protein
LLLHLLLLLNLLLRRHLLLLMLMLWLVVVIAAPLGACPREEISPALQRVAAAEYPSMTRVTRLLRPRVPWHCLPMCAWTCAMPRSMTPPQLPPPLPLSPPLLLHLTRQRAGSQCQVRAR